VASSRALSNVKILAVEDHADTRLLLKVFLERSGADVIAVESGLAALSVIQRHKFDVRLCDIGMPDMDGYQFLQKVRDLEPQIGCQPAIACTAYAIPTDVARAQRAGFQAHVAKPIDPTELIKIILNVVSAGPPSYYKLP
jgi:CheY-like chemotaxis protein